MGRIQIGLGLCLLGWLHSGTLASTNELESCRNSDAFHDIEKTVERCTKAIDTAGLSAQELAPLHLKRGRAFYWANRLEQSLGDLDRAVFFDPDLIRAYIDRGWAKYASGQYSQSIEDFREALTRDPDSADAYFGIGFVYRSSPFAGTIAKGALEQALSLDPKHYLARLNLAELYFYTLQQTEPALAEIDKIVNADPADVAKVEFKVFGSRQPSHDFYVDVRLTKIEFLIQLKRNQDALADADWLINHYPSIAGAYAARARLLQIEHDYAGAIAAADRAIALDPEGEDQRGVKLDALYELRRPDDTLALANAILGRPATEFARGQAFYFKARVLKDRGQIGSAGENFEQSFRYAPFYLQLMLQRMRMRGYYAGSESDSYNESAAIGLKACVIDPEC